MRGVAPQLLVETGVGPISAAQLYIPWSHPGRLRSDAAFAMLAGAAPIPASSGQTIRYRLNRGGDRQLNCALHAIVLTRLVHDPATRAYAARRAAQGKHPTRSSAASSATSPATSSASSKPKAPNPTSSRGPRAPEPSEPVLDIHRSLLAIALAAAACHAGRRVRFTTLAGLANELQEADSRRELTRVVGRYARIELLVVDLGRHRDYADTLHAASTNAPLMAGFSASRRSLWRVCRHSHSPSRKASTASEGL